MYLNITSHNFMCFLSLLDYFILRLVFIFFAAQQRLTEVRLCHHSADDAGADRLPKAHHVS